MRDGTDGGGWVPSRPAGASGETSEAEGGRGPSPGEHLEAELRRARRPALLTLPEALRTGRVAVSSTAVVSVLALVVALGCAFVLRILWAERAVGGVAGVGSVHATQATGGAGSSGAVPKVASRSPDPSASTGVGPGPRSGASDEVVVHVIGQVRKPGLVRLPSGARVADAIKAAGGATQGAELIALNLARLVTDGEQILVPKPGEVATAPGAAGGPGPGGTPGTTGGGFSSVVNLNTADLASLDTLPGVGPVLAQRILDWRTEHGRFTSVDELGEVSGIGDKLMAQLRPKVRV